MKSSRPDVHGKFHGLPQLRFEDQQLTSFSGLTLSLQTLGHIGFARQWSLGLRGNALGPFVRLDLRTC